jgi:hypothetical protein
MTFQEIVDNAKARGLDFSVTYPTTDRVLFRRIEIRQQELFSAADRVNPDYYGVSASSDLDANFAVDIKDMEASVDVDPAAAITRVEVFDAGSSPSLAGGDEIGIVSIHDVDAEIPPRMTLRNFVLTGVGQDLLGVISVKAFYGYRPANKTTPLDGSEVAELPDVYQELLVMDLTQWMVQQTLEMDAGRKTAALEVLGVDEGQMLDAFLQEVVDYAGAQVSRFGDVKGAQRL